jgi:hypothetical protein
MNKMGFDPEEKKPLGFFFEKGKSQKQEAEDTDRIVSTLRADMIQSSEAVPEQENVSEKFNIKLVIGIVISLVIFIVLIFLVTGSRRQMFAKGLQGLFNRGGTPSSMANSTPVFAMENQPGVNQTPEASATNQPTKTQTVIVPPTAVRTPTQQEPTKPPTNTPTATSSWQCRDALSITLDDVGQTVCTYGTVIETVEKSNNFMVIFSHERGAFYWVTYDLVWLKGEVDTCYFTTGKIDQIANTPILVFGYTNLPEICP